MERRQADLSEDQWIKAETIVNLGLDAVSSEEDPSCSSEEEEDRRRLSSRILERRQRKVRLRPFVSQETLDITAELDNAFIAHIATERQKKMKWTLVRDNTCPISVKDKPNWPEWMIRPEWR